MRQNIATVVNPPTRVERRAVFAVLGLQTIIMTLVALIWWLFEGPALAVGAVLGGVACLIPALLLISVIYAANKVRLARRVALLLFGGEFIRLLLSAMAIAMVIITNPILLWPTLSGFLAAQLGAWFAPFLENPGVASER